MTTFISFPSIEAFHNVRRLVANYPHFVNGPITYKGKVKLHGTNAGIRIKPDGKIYAQSRTATIAVGNDNAGFAAWLETRKPFFENVALDHKDVTIFGEWCGPGIQKGTGINLIPNKIFVVFSIQIGEHEDDTNKVIVEPSEIRDILGDLPSDIFILPWYGDEISIHWLDGVTLEKNAKYLSDLIDTIEPCDPWVKDTFGQEGICEGLVFYPIFENLSRWQFSNFTFKAKGEKHKVVKQRQIVQVDPEVAATIDQFVENVVTPARLEQGVREVSGGEFRFDNKLIGPFVGWVSKDVSKETEAELEASGLEWKHVSKKVVEVAKLWYLENLNKN